MSVKRHVKKEKWIELNPYIIIILVGYLAFIERTKNGLFSAICVLCLQKISLRALQNCFLETNLHKCSIINPAPCNFLVYHTLSFWPNSVQMASIIYRLKSFQAQKKLKLFMLIISEGINHKFHQLIYKSDSRVFFTLLWLLRADI